MYSDISNRKIRSNDEKSKDTPYLVFMVELRNIYCDYFGKNILL